MFIPAICCCLTNQPQMQHQKAMTTLSRPWLLWVVKSGQGTLGMTYLCPQCLRPQPGRHNGWGWLDQLRDCNYLKASLFTCLVSGLGWLKEGCQFCWLDHPVLPCLRGVASHSVAAECQAGAFGENQAETAWPFVAEPWNTEHHLKTVRG